MMLPHFSHTLRVSAVQFPVGHHWSEKQFWETFSLFLVKAKKEKAHLIFFPELLTLNLLSKTKHTREIENLSKSFSQRYIEKVIELSKQSNMIILGGTTPRHTSKEILNTAVLAFPNGTFVLQDKLYLTPDETCWGWKAGKKLHIIHTPWGVWVILICYDVQFAQLSHLLAPHQPDLILVPSMTDLYGLNRVRWAAQARAIEHHAYVAVTGTVSPNKKDVGQAVFLSPQDAFYPRGPLLEGKFNKPGLFTAKLDFRKLRKQKSIVGIYSSRDTLKQKRKIPLKAVKIP